MPQDQNNLVWLDMEMTGLEPERDRIIEIAIVVTDSQLNTVAEAQVLVVHQSDGVLEAMDDWNKSTHARSGLIAKVKASVLTEAEAEQQCLDFLAQHVPSGTSPICGNSICQDRRFLARCMPAKGLTKHGKHEALADIYESIEELKYYREHFLKV
jgi:oligoribonuclease